MPATPEQIRNQYPQYRGLDDATTLDRVYSDYYRDMMPREEFQRRMSGTQQDPMPTPFRPAEVPGNIGRTAADVAQSLGTGVVTGAHEIAMLPSTIDRGIDWARRKITGGEVYPQDQAMWDREDATRLWRDSLLHQPTTTPGEYAKTVGEFIPGAGVLGPVPGMVSRVSKFGVIPGLLSEAAGQATEGTPYETAARIAGGLTGGIGAAMVSRPSTAAQALRQSLPRGVNAKDVNAAEGMITQAQQMGVTLTWPEALARVTNGRVDITDVQRVLEQSRGGRPVMSAVMAARPGQIDLAGSKVLRQMGPLEDPVAVGMRLQRDAQQSLDSLRNRINRATRNLYQRGEVQVIDSQSFNLLNNDPLFQRALRAVRRDPAYARYIQGMPDQSVGVIDQVKQFLQDESSAFSTTGRQTKPAAYNEVARDARDAGARVSPEYAEATRRQAQYRQNVLMPAQAGPLGRLASTPDLGKQIDALFVRAPLEGSEKVIGQAVRRIVREDPAAAATAVRVHLRREFDEAMQTRNARPNEWGGARFVDLVVGNKQQGKNLEAAVRALPDGDIRWQGFREFLDVMEATGRRQPANSATAANQMLNQQFGRGGIPGTVASLASSPGSVLTYVRDGYTAWRYGRNTEQMAKILTDPNSGPIFRQILRSTNASEKAQLAGMLLYQSSEISQGRLGNQPPTNRLIPQLPAPPPRY